ncbi:MAG TPA: butyrate kinase [Candidatus Bathyarchaeia archaeon]|nr:butyrate kinase [Candidatus Bathyarchaeia archaeon]
MSVNGEQRDEHRLESVADLLEVAGGLPPSTVVVAGGDRVEDLRLVESARDHGIVDRVILVGQRDPMARAVEEVGIEIRPEDIVAAGDDHQVAAATVGLIRAGGIDIVLKGNISTPIINRQMLALASRPTVGLATIFDAAPIAGGRPMVLTDAGVTTVCNFGRLAGLVRNAVDLAHIVMNIPRPRVAILSANEKQIASLPSTWLGAELTKRDWPDAVVYGPLSFDLATDPRSVATKGLPDIPAAHEVAGQADVLVCPGIDAANILYKTITAMIKYGQASLAGITVGFPVPYIILSRADTLATRLESVALCSIYAHKDPARHAAASKPVAPSAVKPSRVFVINPGSTSVKIALYEDDRCAEETEIPRVAASANTPAERRRQVEDLTRLVRDVFDQWGQDHVDAVAARGGLLPRPDGKLPGGVYVVAERRAGKIIVEEEIVAAMLDYPEKDHASNLAIPIAAALARQLEVPAFAVDPVAVDEFSPEAEISGYAPLTRRSTAHALSVRAAARRAAEQIGRPMEDMKLVVAHLGGGITVAAVDRGKIVDNNIALLGGGPFTPQRAGQLPLEGLIDLCYSGRFTRDELVEELTKRGGLESYLGEHRMEIIEKRIADGDERARLVVDAMIYQVAKEIGAMFAAVGCDVEAIVLTGGLVRSHRVRGLLRRRVERLAPVMVFEGSLEMAALASGAIEVLSGRANPHRYRLPEGLAKKERT